MATVFTEMCFTEMCSFSPMTAAVFLDPSTTERGSGSMMSFEEIPSRLPLGSWICLHPRSVKAHRTVAKDREVEHVAVLDVVDDDLGF
jgi:hypothetical protein